MTARLPLSAGAIVAAGSLAAAAAIGVLVSGLSPLMVLGLPVGVLGAIAAARAPELFALGALALISVEGTLKAHTGLPTIGPADLLMAAIVAGAVGNVAFTVRRERVLLWPGLMAIVGYVGITGAQIITAQSISLGLNAFRGVAWLILAGFVLTVSLRTDRARTRLVDGALLIASGVVAYACLRAIIGPSPQELQNALSVPGYSAKVGKEVPTFGSFSARGSLARWGAITVPFALSYALLGRRPMMRMLAAATVPLGVYAVFATDVRVAIAAVVAGVLAVIALQQFTRSSRGPRIGVTLVASLTIAIGGAVVFALAVGGDSQKASRYGQLLNPTSSESYNTRLQRWPEAIRVAISNPAGLGLGTTSRDVSGLDYIANTGVTQLDNAYLQVAVEQGIPGFLLLAAGLLGLLVGLVRRGINAPGRDEGMHAIAAAGSLVAVMVMLYTGSSTGAKQLLLLWVLVAAAASASVLRGSTQVAQERQAADAARVQSRVRAAAASPGGAT